MDYDTLFLTSGGISWIFNVGFDICIRKIQINYFI